MRAGTRVCACDNPLAFALPTAGEAALPDSSLERSTVGSSSQTQTALRDLVAAGPIDSSRKIVGEVLAVERNALRGLVTITVVLGALVVFGTWWALPSPADELNAERRRIDADLTRLEEVVKGFRADHGVLPNRDTWIKMASRGDPQFFDPWARPYLLETEGDRVVLRTLGRDGVTGGSDDDEDRELVIPPAHAAR